MDLSEARIETQRRDASDWMRETQPNVASDD